MLNIPKLAQKFVGFQKKSSKKVKKDEPEVEKEKDSEEKEKEKDGKQMEDKNEKQKEETVSYSFRNYQSTRYIFFY